MFLAGRKFFLFVTALSPLLACALPNFAALAPTAEPTLDSSLEIPTRPVVEGQSVNIGERVAPPNAPVPVSQLPASSINTTSQDAGQVQISLGVPYQISQAAQLFTSPPAGQSVVYWATNGAKIDFKLSDGSPISDLVIVETEASNYYLVPLPADNVTYSLGVDLENGQAAQVKGDFFFGFPPERIFEQGEVPDGDVGRVDLNATANRPVLIEVRSSAGLDAVLEIYDTDGVLLSVDETGAGQSEVVIYTPEQTELLTLVILGFQGTSGPFEINVTEFP